jgi:DNA-binding XRE family transcriptional regulator
MVVPRSPLKQLRQKLGMSRAEFGRAIGISAQMEARLEKGDSRLPVKCMPELPKVGADPIDMLNAQENYVRDVRFLRKAIRDS